MEKPAQQEQMQKGEQVSLCASSWCVDFVISVFALSAFLSKAVSAQGKTLSANINKAIMKAISFIGGKDKLFTFVPAFYLLK